MEQGLYRMKINNKQRQFHHNITSQLGRPLASVTGVQYLIMNITLFGSNYFQKPTVHRVG